MKTFGGHSRSQIVYEPAGKNTTRAPNMVCVSQVNRPWKRASFALAKSTLETDASIASAIRGPDASPTYFAAANGA